MDWKSRISNPTFWIGLVSAILLLVQVVLKTFGVEIDINVLEVNLIEIVNCVFAVLVILGVVVNPTTPGISD